MVKVALCICTHRRPAALLRLLKAVANLDFDGQLSVIIVDNDVEKEGLVACRSLVAYRWRLTCLIERQRGVAFARNCAVGVALSHSPDFIAMLDDDEWPSRHWLQELLRVQAKTNADVVGGPVLPIFPPNSAPWSKLTHYYGADLRRPDCATCLLYAAGNFLARTQCFQSLMPTPFDPDFNQFGEDLVFFLDSLNLVTQWHGRHMAWFMSPFRTIAWTSTGSSYVKSSEEVPTFVPSAYSRPAQSPSSFASPKPRA